MQKVIDFFSTGISVLLAVVFKVPNRRFDQLVGSESYEYVEFIDREAVVVETVTVSAGTVRFAGSYWRSRIAPESQLQSIAIGERVVISATRGTILLVLHGT